MHVGEVISQNFLKRRYVAANQRRSAGIFRREHFGGE
jgi:hypothetical protein